VDASHGALPAGALQAQIRHVIKKCAECVCVCVCVCLRSLRVEDVLCGWNDGRAASTHTRVFLMQEDKISSIYYIYIYVTYNNNDACFMFGVLFGLLCIAIGTGCAIIVVQLAFSSSSISAIFNILLLII